MRPHLGVRQQIALMRRRWRDFRCERRGQQIVWRGWLQPATWSTRYRVEVRYAPRRHEHRGGVAVRVLEPALCVSDHQVGEVHLYRDRHLCLFNPHRREWAPSMPVAETIIPWTSQWIYFYEVWCQTGEWLGGGEHGDAHMHEAPDEVE